MDMTPLYRHVPGAEAVFVHGTAIRTCYYATYKPLADELSSIYHSAGHDDVGTSISVQNPGVDSKAVKAAVTGLADASASPAEQLGLQLGEGLLQEHSQQQASVEAAMPNTKPKRKKRKRLRTISMQAVHPAGLTAEQAASDAKHPGNAMHRPIISHLQTVHAAFISWWHQQKPGAAHHTNQQGTSMTANQGSSAGTEHATCQAMQSDEATVAHQDASDDKVAHHTGACSVHSQDGYSAVHAPWRNPGPIASHFDWAALVDAHEAELKRYRQQMRRLQADNTQWQAAEHAGSTSGEAEHAGSMLGAAVMAVASAEEMDATALQQMQFCPPVDQPSLGAIAARGVLPQWTLMHAQECNEHGHQPRHAAPACKVTWPEVQVPTPPQPPMILFSELRPCSRTEEKTSAPPGLVQGAPAASEPGASQGQATGSHSLAIASTAPPTSPPQLQMRVQPLMGQVVEGPGLHSCSCAVVTQAQTFSIPHPTVVDSQVAGPACPTAHGTHTCTCSACSMVAAEGHEVEALTCGTRVVLPHGSRFLLSSLKQIHPLVADGRRYQLIVADPPWENSSVARGGGGYHTLATLQLLALPLRELLDQEHGLVAMWVTNRPRIHAQLHSRLLPAWGLQHVATWYWLKVDAKGVPVVPLSCMHRHPYEQLMLLRPCRADAQGAEPAAATHAGASVEVSGVHSQGGSEAPAAHGCAHRQTAGMSDAHSREFRQDSTAGNLGQAHALQPMAQPSEGFTLVTHPATHSRKPPIGPLLYQYCMPRGMCAPAVCDLGMLGIVGCESKTASQVVDGLAPEDCMHEGARSSLLLPPPGMACLEMFARELQPCWTAWGNEVLKFAELHGCFEGRNLTDSVGDTEWK